MPDLKKVVEGLDCCAKWMDDIDEDACNRCPYHGNFSYDDHGCLGEVNNDAIFLLKELEPKEVMVAESTNMYTGLPITHCPKCGVSLDRYLYGRQYEGEINYCPFCGQAIKWE